MSTPDPWCGLEFGDPTAPKRTVPLSSRSAVLQALVAADASALTQALAALSPRSRRPAALTRQLVEHFSPACAQVLFEQGLLPPRTAFDLAVATQDVNHMAWWLSDKDRIAKMQEETRSLRYQSAHQKRSSYSWLDDLMKEWAEHHSQAFIQIAKTAHWPSLRTGRGQDDGLPVKMLAIALKDERVTVEDVRAVLEKALDPSGVFLVISPSTYSSHANAGIPVATAQGLAMSPLRAELLSTTPAIAARLQEVVSGSPLLSSAWQTYWAQPATGDWRRRKFVSYPGVSQHFEVYSHNLLEDHLIHASPAMVALLSKDDMGKPAPSTRVALQCLVAKPDILSAFTANLSPEPAPVLMSRLAPHLSQVRCRNEQGQTISYAQLCLARFGTLTMFSALARHGHTADQLLVPDATTGVTPTDEFLKKARLTASQKEQVEKAVARGRRALLGKLAADTVTEERAASPRRGM